MEELRLYETEQTYISVDKGKIYVKNPKTGEISPRAITLCPGFQIELGRNYLDFRDALRQARVPVFFKEVITRNQRTYMLIVRMETGKVPTTELASVVCEDNIIKSLAPIQQIKDNVKYQKYLPLPDFYEWSLPAGKSEEEKKAREDAAVEFLKKRFPLIGNDDMEMITENNAIEICVTHNCVKMKFTMISNPKENGRYVFAGLANMI